MQLYTLTNRHGLVARITNYGAIVTELHVPDRDGRLADIVLGFDNLDGYLAGHPYFGAIVGRVANRIGLVQAMPWGGPSSPTIPWSSAARARNHLNLSALTARS